ncbi:XPC-binding domain [Seminavis robusta]|uniref:UV excision repair protein RAD23 n=1 Tax=Seminavis robusta TaxID=568900 RepID=A0A9N8EVW2_9STRA|nr:XPC-binding domain [Seminavis robusta]|eukprot:Sro1843_g301140.1 XPC-binding domain (158) ;mRNA; r:3974-4447
MANPEQMAQMIQSMSPAELNQMAAMMGLSADQLRQTAQMLGQIPPEQLQQYMMQAMGGGGMGDMAGLMGGAGAGEGGPQVLRLNEEEMAAVNRLTEMGFDRAEAAQAFLACDKNEALAANLLMDGGFGFGGDGGSGSGGNGGSNGGGGDNDDDAMYD